MLSCRVLMAARRRIDWSVILGPEAEAPNWGDHRATSEFISLLRAFDDLFLIEDTEAMLKRAVELALAPVGLVRAGLYLYDAPVDLMLGTWGTNLRGEVVDEHHAMFEAGANGQRVFERAASGDALWTVVENCPIIDQSEHDTKIVGKGWVVCTPIRSARAPLGMLYNDAGLTSAEVDPKKQAHAAILCSLVGSLLETAWHAHRLTKLPNVTAKHPVVGKVVRMLAHDPTLGGKDMAAKVDISLSRLARLFKSEMGQSLVDYRNGLRLERFLKLVDSGGANLLEAALAAGFGSYAQFHRVFCGAYKRTPREYLSRRGHRNRQK